MKKMVSLILASVVAIFMMSGCSSKNLTYVKPAETRSYDSDKVKQGDLVMISVGAKETSSWTPGSDGIYSAYLSMQIAAQDTLKNGNSFFSIYRPIAISDFDGNGFENDIKFFEKCIEENIPTVTAVATQTRYAMNYCGTTQYLTAHLEIVQYKDKPTTITSYEANQVIKIIKDKGHFIEASEIGEWKEADFKSYSKRKWIGHNAWFNARRSDTTLYTHDKN